MENFDIARKALDTSANSSGSAMKEHAKWMESMEAKTLQFKAAWEELSVAFMDDSFLKNLVDAGTDVLSILTKIIDTFGTLPTLITAVAAAMSFKNTGIFRTIEDEASISGLKIASIFGNISKQIKPISFSSSFSNQLMVDETALLKFSLALKSGIPEEIAFKEAMAGTSVAAQQFARQMAITGESVAQFTLNQKTAEMTMMAQDKSFSNVGAIIQTYNKGLDKTGLTQSQFIDSVSKGNSVLGKYFSKVGIGNATMGGYVKTLIATKAATIGVQMATMALNAVIGMGIGLIMSLMSSGIQKFVEWVKDATKSTTEKLKDINTEFLELSDTIKTTADDFKSLKSKADEIIPRFSELAKGVDEFGNNISLTDKEYEEFISLQNQIADMFPEINGGMDSNGNAMLMMSYSAETLTKSLWDLVEAQRQAANEEIAEKIPDIIDNTNKFEKVNNKEKKHLQTRLDNYNKAKEELDKLYSEESKSGYKSAYGDDWEKQLKTDTQNTNAARTLIMDAWGDLGNVADAEAWQTMVSKYTDPKTLEIDWYSILNSKEFENRMSGFEKQVNNTGNIIDARWKQLSSTFSAWTQTNDSFKDLDDSMKNISLKMVANLDYGADNLDTESEIKDFISQKILDPLKNATPEVKKAFEDLYNINPTKEGLSTQEYKTKIQSQIQKIADSSDDFSYDDLLKNTGFEKIISKYDNTAKNIKGKISGVTDEMVYSLSPDEMTKAFDYITDYGIDSWDELLSALENKTFEPTIDLKIETEGLAKLSAAISESTSATGLAEESISSLTKRYSELSGFDTAGLFEKTSHGIHLNAKAARELEAEYEKQNKTNLDKKLKGLTEQYEDLTKKINNCTDAQEVADLYAKRDNVLNQINDVAELAAQYEGLTSAFKKWSDAQSTPDEDDMFKSLSDGLKDIQELFKSGRIGVDDFREAVQLMTDEDLSTASVEKLLEVYKSGMPTMQKFFTGNSNGLLNFLNLAKSASDKYGKDWVSLSKDGKWKIDLGVGGDAELAKAVSDMQGLQMSTEEVQILLRALAAYGFDVNLDSAYSSFEYLLTEAEKANEKLKELGKTTYTFNFNTTDVRYVNEQITEAKKVLDEFRDKDGKVNLGVEGAEEAQNILATLLTKKNQLSDTSAIMKVDTSSVTESSSEIEKLMKKFQDFKKAYEELKVITEIGADTTKAQEKVDTLFAELKKTDIPANLNINTESADATIESIKAMSPEMMVSAGLNDKLIKGYVPDGKNAYVKYDSNQKQLDAWKPKNKRAFVTYTPIGSGSLWDSITGKTGESKAQGNAYANGKYGKNGAKDSGVALVGELGREMVVRDGKFFTIGDDSAELFQYKKNDIKNSVHI